MIKRHLLEARMKEQQVKYDDLLKALDMKNYQTLHKRLTGKVDFKLYEINTIRKKLNLTSEQADEIFYFDVEI